MHLHPRAVARALRGEAHGNRVLAPGPGHSARDRSLSILISWQAPERFVVHSHAGDDPLVCRDYVRERLGLSRDHRPVAAPAETSRRRENLTVIDRERTEFPLALWGEAGPHIGTPAEVYLASRGLSYEGAALRWHANCPFGKERVGCMLGLVRNVLTNEAQAVHRTAIDAAGRKLSHLGANGRLSLGPTSGGAVKLTDDADVTVCLGVTEGLETALSMRAAPEFGQSPVWSLVHAGGLALFPVLAGIQSLWIGVDHDPAGLRASEELASRYHAAEREVFLIKPHRLGADLNDVIRRQTDA